MLLSVCATVGLGRRLKKADGKKSKHKVSDDTVGSQAFPQLVLFDDSLHNRRRDASTNGLVVDFRASADGALSDAERARRRRAVRPDDPRDVFGTQSQELVLGGGRPDRRPERVGAGAAELQLRALVVVGGGRRTGEPARRVPGGRARVRERAPRRHVEAR